MKRIEMKGYLGRHFLMEFYGCDERTLRDVEFVRNAMLGAAREANATIVKELFHQFSPYGVSGVVVISESHLAIHTWPEHGCASVDFFSCAESVSAQTIERFLQEAFKASETSAQEYGRGRLQRLSEKGTAICK